MKKILFILFISIKAICQPAIFLPEIAHDFGTITEGVQASYTFKVENRGTEPLLISNVKPSCGCTTPDWTKTPILPGGKGFIMTTFNSTGRPGSFAKTIAVESNSSQNAFNINIKGFVGPKVDKEYTAEEKNNSPKISFERADYNFGKVESGQTIRQKIKITNTGKSPLKISGTQTGCHCVDYDLKNAEILPGKSEEILFLYRPTNTGDQTDIISLASNDIVSKDNNITFRANIVPGFGGGSILNSSPTPSPFK